MDLDLNPPPHGAPEITMGQARRGRFQLSPRTFLVATAVVAVLLALAAWGARERHRLYVKVLGAREVAIRSVVLEEQARAAGRLRLENEALRDRVERLRLENEQLRRRVLGAEATPPAPPDSPR